MANESDSVTLTNADELDGGKVSKNGQLFVGKGYAGKQVKYVLRVEGDEDESDSTDAENA